MNWRNDNARDALLRPGEEPPLAAHLVTPRSLYSHHGIYIGGGQVIHYAGLAYGLRRGQVENVSLERFARGRDVRIRPDAPKFDSRQVVARARSRLGERRYRLLTNNCEHFCGWVLRGQSCSTQVERLLALPRRLIQWYRRGPSSERMLGSLT
jgi:Lecithin retinol acyltransferase